MSNSNDCDLLVIFAGGPHTRPRVERARDVISERRPQTVIMTGREFVTTDTLPVETMRTSKAADVLVHAAENTWQSCRHLDRFLDTHQGTVTSLTAVTSNYHRPRLAWLLRPVTTAHHTRLSLVSTSDVCAADLRHNATARRLIRGELVSWLYCAPLGLWLWIRLLLRRLVMGRHPSASR